MHTHSATHEGASACCFEPRPWLLLGRSTSHYLFIRARTINHWMYTDAAAPPLNLLSVPYYLMHFMHRVSRVVDPKSEVNCFRPEHNYLRKL
eukprot:4354240-Prymnesium_polylepis.4